MSPSQKNWPFIINVGNSIIGVTVLAMPYCFKQCGIILGSLLLFFSTWLTVVSCELLMKAGVTSRRRSFSLLAYYTHGATGKLIVELGMVGLQVGTMIAQVVVIGDLGSAIVAKATGIQNSGHLRSGVIVFLCLCVGLPLALLKDIRALAKASTMCILFYTVFCGYVVLLSIPNLISGTWYSRVNFWRQEGFLKCLPIFSFAFGCQTQLFIVYDALAEPSLKKMNSIVSSAVHMCTVCYLLVGFFGYITFYDVEDMSGDILNHLKENTLSDALKLCFVISIAVSMPLIIFPCRASLHTLLFPPKPKDDIPYSSKMPESHFKGITLFIMVASMIIAILIPNIEFVLALTGATTGTLICYIFPALFFLNVMSDNSEKKASGRLVLVIGLTILVVCTFTTLRPPSPTPGETSLHGDQVRVVKEMVTLKDIAYDSKQDFDVKGNAPARKDQAAGGKEPVGWKDAPGGVRLEPPIPQEPYGKQNADLSKDEHKVPENKVVHEKTGKRADSQGGVKKEKKAETNIKETDATGKKHEVVNNNELNTDNKEDEKKKEAEKLKLEEEEKKKKEAEKKQEQILEKLEQQQAEQKKLIAEQREILEELKQHNEKHKVGEDAKAPLQAANGQQHVDGLQNQHGGQQVDLDKGLQVNAGQGQQSKQGQQSHVGQNDLVQHLNVGQMSEGQQINMGVGDKGQTLNVDQSFQGQKSGQDQQLNIPQGQHFNVGQDDPGQQLNANQIQVGQGQQLNVGQGQQFNAGQVGQGQLLNDGQGEQLKLDQNGQGQQLNVGEFGQGQQLNAGQGGQGQQINVDQMGQGQQKQNEDQLGQGLQLNAEQAGKGQQDVHVNKDIVNNQNKDNPKQLKEEANIGRDLLSDLNGKILNRQNELDMRGIDKNDEALDTFNRAKREARISNEENIERQNSIDLNTNPNLENNKDIKDESKLTKREKDVENNILDNKNDNHINTNSVIDSLNVNTGDDIKKETDVLNNDPQIEAQDLLQTGSLNYKHTEHLNDLIKGLKDTLGESVNVRKGILELQGSLGADKRR